jgi:hypothetical protein
MVDDDGEGVGDEDAPVAIEGEQGERAENVKVRFDAAAGEVDEERRSEGLTERDRVSRDRCTGIEDSEQEGEKGNKTAEEDAGDDVRMCRADLPFPGER